MQSEEALPPKGYSRWEAIVALCLVLLLVTLVPRSVRAFPQWGVGLIAVVVLVPLVVNSLRRPGPFWSSAERLTLGLYFYFSVPATAARCRAPLCRAPAPPRIGPVSWHPHP